jgi:hypothetical protein
MKSGVADHERKEENQISTTTKLKKEEKQKNFCVR